jgi:Ca2+-binding RTX toxin-like protein
LALAAPRPVDFPGGPVTQTVFFGTIDDDNYTGTAEIDVFLMIDGGDDTVSGLAANDQIVWDSMLTAADTIDGGADTDTLMIEANYTAPIVLGSTTLRNVEVVLLNGNYTYDLRLHEATVGAGQTMEVRGSASFFLIDASADTDAALIKMTGGNNADAFTGGAGTNLFQGGGGGDELIGGGGTDTFIYAAVSESTGPVYDTVMGFDFRDDDLFDLWFTVTGTDDNVTIGTLSAGTFNSDLAAAVGAGALAANHAVLFRPDAGTLNGEIFLIVDVNGTAGYQANADLVVHLEATDHAKKFAADDFA